MKKQVEIRIFPDGRIEAETHGITGKACADYRRVLEKLLDARTTQIQYTDEYYMEEAKEETLVEEELIL